MYLSEVCDYYPLRVNNWGAIHLDEELQAAVDEDVYKRQAFRRMGVPLEEAIELVKRAYEEAEE